MKIGETYKGKCVGVNLRTIWNRAYSDTNEEVLKSTLNFVVDESSPQTVFSLEVEGKYEIGDKVTLKIDRDNVIN